MIPDDELIEEVVDHVCEYHPEAVAPIADEEIERRAGIAVARAKSHGFQTETSVIAFAALMFVAGPNFDQQPAIKAALADPAVSPDERMKRLMSHTKEEDWEATSSLPSDWPA
jgi:hypothetical protein